MAEAQTVGLARSGSYARAGEEHERALSRREKRTMALLGLPTMALALAVTMVTTYLPVIAPRGRSPWRPTTRGRGRAIRGRLAH